MAGELQSSPTMAEIESFQADESQFLNTLQAFSQRNLDELDESDRDDESASSEDFPSQETDELAGGEGTRSPDIPPDSDSHPIPGQLSSMSLGEDDIQSLEESSQGSGGPNRKPRIDTDLESSRLARFARLLPELQSSDDKIRGPIKVGSELTKIVDDITKSTGTRSTLQYVLDGVENAVRTLGSEYVQEHVADEEVDEIGVSVSLAVWLLVCYKSKTNLRAKHPSRLCGSLSNSAMEILESLLEKVEPRSLALYIQYWELRFSESHSWPSQQWLQTIPKDLDVHLPRKVRPKAAMYEDSLEAGGIKLLTDYILSREDPSPYNPLAQMLKTPGIETWLRREICLLLMVMDEAFLRAIIRRRIGQDSYNRTQKVFKELKENDRTIDSPAIYINVICDYSGLPPTARQWRGACLAAREYIAEGTNSNNLAETVDQLISASVRWPRSLAQQGFRRYMDWRKGNEKTIRKPYQPRRDIVKRFLKAFTRRLDESDSEGLRFCPLADEIVEIGFSMHPQRRLAEHANHSHSNYLMNLMQALLEHIYPGMFKLEQHILYPCWNAAQCFLGEIVFTQLADGYIVDGGGFSHHPAGRSNSGAFRSFNLPMWDDLTFKAEKRWNIPSRLKYWEEECQRRPKEWEDRRKREAEESAARVRRMGEEIEQMEEQAALTQRGMAAIEALGDFVDSAQSFEDTFRNLE